MQRDQLADEEARERLVRCPARPEQPLLRADEADGEVVTTRQLLEEACVRVGVGDDEVGGAKRMAVDTLQCTCRQRAGSSGYLPMC